jgi:hypothetical protein
MSRVVLKFLLNRRLIVSVLLSAIFFSNPICLKAAPLIKKERTIALVIVEMPGNEVQLSAKDAGELIWGKNGVANSLRISTFNQISLKKRNPTVFGPVVIMPKKNDSCDKSYRSWSNAALDILGVEAKSVRSADHAVFLFPTAESLGCSARARGELFGSQSWIFGEEASTILHELGHNFGLGHAAQGSLNKIEDSYGDYSSPMGYTTNITHLLFNAPQLKQLSLFPNPSEILSIKTPGSYRLLLSPLERALSEVKTIEVVTQAPKRKYIISYRKFKDSRHPSLRHFQRGVSIHLDKGLGKNTTLVKILEDQEVFFDHATALLIRQIQRNSLNQLELEIVYPGNLSLLSELDHVVSPHFDLDDDGVDNDLDCAPEDKERWNSAIANDLDHDFLPDSLVPAGVCIGDNLSLGQAPITSHIDNCLGMSDRNTRDIDGDGIGDACSSSESLKKARAAIYIRQASSSVSALNKALSQEAQSMLKKAANHSINKALEYYSNDKLLQKLKKELAFNSNSATSSKLLKQFIKEETIPPRPNRIKGTNNNREMVASIVPCHIVRSSIITN